MNLWFIKCFSNCLCINILIYFSNCVAIFYENVSLIQPYLVSYNFILKYIAKHIVFRLDLHSHLSIYVTEATTLRGRLSNATNKQQEKIELAN